jgi:dihydroxyacetone kinase-like protein
MKLNITTDDVIAILNGMVDDIETGEHYLNDVDSALGDGDHGMSMAMGFRAVRQKLPELAGQDIGTILKIVGVTLVSSVGGSAGPLYGTMFLRAAAAIGPKAECDVADLVNAGDAAAKGLSDRGQCQIGDKTLLDIVAPAVEALKSSHARGSDLTEALEGSLNAGRQALESTRNMICRRGRFSRFGERSIGHLDPGAASALLLLESAVRTLANRG